MRVLDLYKYMLIDLQFQVYDYCSTFISHLK